MVAQWEGIIRVILWLGRGICRLCGYFCIAIALALISSIIYVYFHSLFPLMYDVGTVFGAVNFMWDSWVTFNLMFNYILCVVTRPGAPHVDLLSPDDRERLLSRVAADPNTRLRKGDGRTLRWCQTCQQPKPPRAHHCHACGACVLKMDHHCPWINSCVGHHNHRYFTLFLVYLWVACAFVVVQTALFYANLLRSSLVPDGSPALAAARSPGSGVMLSFVVCGALTVAVGMFLGWNAMLVLRNETTIEFHFNRADACGSRGMVAGCCAPSMSLYDLGVRRNLQAVFGPFRSAWACLLPSVEPLPTSGMEYPTVRDALHGAEV